MTSSTELPPPLFRMGASSDRLAAWVGPCSAAVGAMLAVPLEVVSQRTHSLHCRQQCLHAVLPSWRRSTPAVELPGVPPR